MEPSSDDLKMANLVARVAQGAESVYAMKEPLGDRESVCVEHGPYSSSGVRYMGRREIWTPCPDCEEARLAANRQEAAQKQAERARLELECQIGEAAIPARFIGRTLDNFNANTPEQQAALRIAREFVQDFDANAKRGNSLIFSGLPGTGKSHLATAMLQALMPRHCGLYTTCMSVIRTVRGTWRKDAERSEQHVLNIYAEVPLLVLDEIGVQYGTDGEQTILFDVLDRRYRDMKPSIFLTNQDKKGFKEFIGERTFDRLTETSRWVPFDWASYRPQARREAA
jgi:DNA replication protein DnaC